MLSLHIRAIVADALRSEGVSFDRVETLRAEYEYGYEVKYEWGGGESKFPEARALQYWPKRRWA